MVSSSRHKGEGRDDVAVSNLLFGRTLVPGPSRVGGLSPLARSLDPSVPSSPGPSGAVGPEFLPERAPELHSLSVEKPRLEVYPFRWVTQKSGYHLRVYRQPLERDHGETPQVL